MDLKKQSEFISCNRITFLDKKYNLYNNLIFDKQIIPKSMNSSTEVNKNPALKSLFIDKKSCIFKEIPDEGLWKGQFHDLRFNTQRPLFNLNTKAKVQDTGCP